MHHFNHTINNRLKFVYFIRLLLPPRSRINKCHIATNFNTNRPPCKLFATDSIATIRIWFVINLWLKTAPGRIKSSPLQVASLHMSKQEKEPFIEEKKKEKEKKKKKKKKKNNVRKLKR